MTTLPTPRNGFEWRTARRDGVTVGSRVAVHSPGSHTIFVGSVRSVCGTRITIVSDLPIPPVSFDVLNFIASGGQISIQVLTVSQQIQELPHGSIVKDLNIDETYLVIDTADGKAYVNAETGRVRTDWWSWDQQVREGQWAVIYKPEEKL